MAALIIYCSTVLGSLMTDFGKATKAEANFRIALYKTGQSSDGVSQGARLCVTDVTALPHGKLLVVWQITEQC